MKLGCTPKGAYGNTAFWDGFWEVLGRVLGKGFSEGFLRSGPAMGFTVKNGSEKGSQTQGALRDILMPRSKNWLPAVSRQFLTLNYPRPNCLLTCLPNYLSPTIEDIFSSFKIAPVARVIARQLSGKNCLAAIFASRHQDASPGPLGKGFWEGGFQKVPRTPPCRARPLRRAPYKWGAASLISEVNLAAKGQH